MKLRILIPLALACGLVTLGPVLAQADTPLELTEKELRYFAKKFKGNCARCHGATGDGSGTAGEGLATQPADFTDPAFMASRTDEQLFEQIEKGGEEKSAMPAFGADSNAGWSEERIRRMVAFLRTFPGASAPGDAEGAQTAPVVAEAPAADEGPTPLVPERVKPGIAYYSDESAQAGDVKGLLQEKNLEEVYQNYTYFEARYDAVARVVLFKEYKRGDVVLTEKYSYDAFGRLTKRTVSTQGAEDVVTRY